MKATVDLDIIIDVLAKRADFHPESSMVLHLCETGKINGHVCAHEMTTLAYFLEKHPPTRVRTTELVESILDILKVLPVGEAVLRSALTSRVADFEDAMVEQSSLRRAIDFIITRDADSFAHSRVKPISPAEVIALYAKAP
jgi:hypothetical protein